MKIDDKKKNMVDLKSVARIIFNVLTKVERGENVSFRKPA